jgi:hypothetical protein
MGPGQFYFHHARKVSSVQVTYPPVLLGTGIFLILTGLLWGSQSVQGGVILIPGGAAAIIAWFAARTSVCVIAADGGAKIQFRTEGMSTEALIEMMDKIERAKNHRVAQVKGL